MSNSSLNSRINTLTQKYTEKENADIQKFKEDYYLKQLDRDTNLLLVIFPILLAITTIATFAGVREEFKRNIAEIKSDSEKQISEYNKSIVHINNLRSGFSFQYANNLHADFKKLLSKPTIDVESLVELGIVVCEHYCYAVGYSTVNTPKFDESISIIISSVIDKMLINIENYNEVKLINMDYVRFINAKKTIEVMIDEENMRRFCKITSKLSFPTLD